MTFMGEFGKLKEHCTRIYIMHHKRFMSAAHSINSDRTSKTEINPDKV